MSQKTLFGYQSAIKSAEVSRGISIPPGVGPIFGFGSGVINNDNGKWQIRLYPNYYNDTEGANGQLPDKDSYIKPYNTYIRPLIKDLIKSHNIQVTGDLENTVGIAKYGLITRDGHLVYDDNLNKDVDIYNAETYTTNGPSEVVVFARHAQIDEAVENEVTYVAYPNTNIGSNPSGTYSGVSSDYSGIKTFYDLFRVSADIYRYKEVDNPNFGLDNPLSEKSNVYGLSYEGLLKQVNSIMGGTGCPISLDDPNYTLVGIYGVGTYQNEQGNVIQESFSIVPYGGKWPYDLPFNLATMSCIAKNFDFVRGITDGFPYTEPNGDTTYKSIKEYIDAKIASIQGSIQQSQTELIPSGLICLWDNASTIPEGWSPYDKANGRIVIGFTSGNQLTLGTGVVQISDAGQTYMNNVDDAWNITLKGTDLPAHEHAIAIVPWNYEDSGTSGDRDNSALGSWDKYSYCSDASGGSWKGNSRSKTTWNETGIKGNACNTSPNLTQKFSNTNISNIVQTEGEIKLNKAFPMIALIYIQKD